jgi:hypothetical protein
MNYMADDESIVRIEEKVDKLGDRLGNIESTLSQQHESLKDHIRRTEVLEKKSDSFEKNMNQFQGAVKFIKLLAVAAAIVEAIRIVMH